MIKELLPTGKENAISSKELAQLAGCTSVRELQQVIAAERDAGAVILSSTKGGYFLPANKQEIKEFCATLTSRGEEYLCSITERQKSAARIEFCICEKQMVFQKSKKSKWFLKSRTARNRSTLLSPDNLILQEGAGRVKRGNCNQNQSGN